MKAFFGQIIAFLGFLTLAYGGLVHSDPANEGESTTGIFIASGILIIVGLIMSIRKKRPNRETDDYEGYDEHDQDHDDDHADDGGDDD